MILARLERPGAARAAFIRALVEANKLLDQTTGHDEATYTRGLALAGLSLRAEAEEREVFLTQAQEAYREASADRAAPGEVAKAALLLDNLLPLDTLRSLAPVRAILGESV